MYTRIYLFTVAVFTVLIHTLPVKAQTCSCAGAPLISSQLTGASSAGNLLFGITYEYHDISSLYSGTTRLADETVTRNTQSVLFEVNYGFTDRLSISGTFSFVDKDRTTGLHTSSINRLLKYSIIPIFILFSACSVSDSIESSGTSIHLPSDSKTKDYKIKTVYTVS